MLMLQPMLFLEVCIYLKCDALDRGEPNSRPRRALIKMAEGVLDEIEETQDEVEVNSPQFQFLHSKWPFYENILVLECSD